MGGFLSAAWRLHVMFAQAGRASSAGQGGSEIAERVDPPPNPAPFTGSLSAHLATTMVHPLPLWERVATSVSSAPGEGVSRHMQARIETPHPASLCEATLSHKGRGCTKNAAKMGAHMST